MNNYYESNRDHKVENNIEIEFEMNKDMTMMAQPMTYNHNFGYNKPMMPGFGRIMPCKPCSCKGKMMGDMNHGPVMEPMQEKVVHKDICHEIKHICPVNTKYVNHHIYKHTYVPQYTCSTEDVCTTVNEGSCCNFR